MVGSLINAVLLVGAGKVAGIANPRLGGLMRHNETLPARAERVWYLVQCKPREDLRAHTHLTRQGFTCFCPMLRAGSRRGNKITQRPSPLFPGYLFIHLHNGDNWSVLRSTRGVSRVVSFAGRPCRVPESIVEQLRQRCDGDELLSDPPKPGDHVQVSIGEQSELDAIFLAMDGTQRVLLLLKLLNTEVQVSVPLSRLSG